MGNSIVTIGGMKMYQKGIASYGKKAEANTVTLNTSVSTATITANDTGVLAKSGDVIYVYPSLTSTSAATCATPTNDGQNLIVNLQYLKNGVGFTEVQSTTAFGTPAPASLTLLVAAINAQFVADGIDDVIEAYVVNTTKFRLQVKQLNATFNIDATSTWDSSNTPEGTAGYLYVLGVKDDTTTSTTSISVAQTFLGKSTITADEGLGLLYEVSRDVGEMTGATLNSTLDPVVYKGLSKVAKQIEYAEGSATLNCDEMVFNIDNLDYIYGWDKDLTGAFQSGKAVGTSGNVTITYSFTEDTIPSSVGLMGVHKKIDGGLILFVADSAKTNNLDLSMKKVEYRTSSVEFSLLTPSSKCVWSLISL